MANSQDHAVGRDAQPELEALEAAKGAVVDHFDLNEGSIDLRAFAESAVRAYLLAAGGTGERERAIQDVVDHLRNHPDPWFPATLGGVAAAIERDFLRASPSPVSPAGREDPT